MLVVMRKQDERIRLVYGDCEINIVVARITQRRTWLAIDAPDECRIHRMPSESQVDFQNFEQSRNGGFD